MKMKMMLMNNDEIVEKMKKETEELVREQLKSDLVLKNNDKKAIAKKIIDTLDEVISNED